MKLSDYLARKNETRDAFGKRVGAHAVTVTRWVTGSLRPSWEHLAEIEAATDGAVTANDFKLPAPRLRNGGPVARTGAAG
jgi:DNA-binding transcriptional regulator YdaS (Cro superfamily)